MLVRLSPNLPIIPCRADACVRAVPTATVHVRMMQEHTFHLIFFHARCDFPHNLNVD